jgi:aspartyl protease family protein
MWKAMVALLVIAVAVGTKMPASSSAAITDQDGSNQSILITPTESTANAFHQSSLGGSVALPRQADGHFYASADVNGTAVDFVIDTGATVVSLTRADAERAGINVDPDRFQVVAQGASGPVMGLPVTLPSLELGGHRLTDVQALVLADGEQSLLGQNVLSRFQSVSIENDEMLLR